MPHRGPFAPRASRQCADRTERRRLRSQRGRTSGRADLDARRLGLVLEERCRDDFPVLDLDGEFRSVGNSKTAHRTSRCLHGISTRFLAEDVAPIPDSSTILYTPSPSGPPRLRPICPRRATPHQHRTRRCPDAVAGESASGRGFGEARSCRRPSSAVRRPNENRRPAGTAAPVGPATGGHAGGSLYTRHALDLLGGDVSPSFFLSAPAKAPRTVCGCQPVAATIWAMVAPSFRRSMAISCACWCRRSSCAPPRRPLACRPWAPPAPSRGPATLLRRLAGVPAAGTGSRLAGRVRPPSNP